MGGATRKSKKPKESELSPVDSTVTPSDLSLDPPPKQLSFDLPFGTGETHSLGLLDFRDSISPQDWIFFSLPKEMMTTIVFSLLPSNFRKNQITPFLSTCKMAYHLFVPFVKYKKSPYQIAASLVGLYHWTQFSYLYVNPVTIVFKLCEDSTFYGHLYEVNNKTPIRGKWLLKPIMQVRGPNGYVVLQEDQNRLPFLTEPGKISEDRYPRYFPRTNEIIYYKIKNQKRELADFTEVALPQVRT